jgi:hypothetical protein
LLHSFRLTHSTVFRVLFFTDPLFALCGGMKILSESRKRNDSKMS